MSPQHKKYLKSTQIMDTDNREIVNYAMDAIKDADEDPITQAVKLYYAVRDDIWYDPYSPFYLPEHYRASNVLKRGRGYCVGKASLLCTLGRFCGIPSRVGFADVRNHLATRQLIEYLGTDLFVYHGYVEFYLEGKWVKATPAFNVELCRKHNVNPLEFNGREDSLFQSCSIEKKQFMEYIEDHGVYADIPVDIIVAGWEKAYGKDRVRQWIEKFEKTGGRSKRNFYHEDVWKA
jgi:transglutaminase-like putative cysteine protease